MNSLFKYFSITFIYIFSCFAYSNTSYSANKCNDNDDCLRTEVCIGGIANNSQVNPHTKKNPPSGICRTNVIISQVCLFHLIMVEFFAKILLVMGLFSFAFSTLFEGWNVRKLLGYVVGATLGVGSMGIASFFTGNYNEICRGAESPPVVYQAKKN